MESEPMGMAEGVLLRLVALAALSGCLPDMAPADGSSVTREEQVSARIEEIRMDLEASEGGRLLWRALERQGGLARWWSGRGLSFRYQYGPVLPSDEPVDVLVRYDPWTHHVRHDDAARAGALGWDGDLHWLTAGEGAGAGSPRVRAHVPVTWVAMPLALMAETWSVAGVREVELGGTPHHRVTLRRADTAVAGTFTRHEIMIDQGSGLVSAVRSVFAWPGLLTGGESRREQWVAYRGSEVVDGLRLATHLHVYLWDAEASERGEVLAEVSAGQFDASLDLTGVNFGP